MATDELDQLTYDYRSEEDEEENEDFSMTLIEHLEELRWRILKSLIAVTIFSIVAFIFRDQLIAFLMGPFPKMAASVTHGKLVVTGIAEGFTVYLLISVVAGLIVSLPVILYQIWAFIAPGLRQGEKKYAVPFIALGVVLFVAGASLGYFVLNYPLEWLLSFGANSFTELISANSYFSFVAFFLLAFGLAFELPLVLTFMAKVGWVSTEMLKSKRKVAHVGIWIASCFITPGADLYSPIFIGVSLSLLYELSILFIHLVVGKQVAEAVS
jgi:sec-independent protein translocase protein TatC